MYSKVKDEVEVKKKIILNLSLNLNLIVKMMNPQLDAEVRFLLLPFISNLIRGFYYLLVGWNGKAFFYLERKVTFTIDGNLYDFPGQSNPLF